ncbi:hypothetical protein [Thermosulfurimonas dismutans]|uniref:Phosphoenolpyruvate carboxykinase [ATP] n=1 Tax=Thermosulfurimonas dismutans TaxID=999894 RepID=A0A179D7I6_9BACT|nr:hypothetical protein [Thermosulfurimonas dismutans]OAQ21412.1 Phosphoenolpyruvate carboxykinase [ATP] [Thermosulfurimonas dismutans]
MQAPYFVSQRKIFINSGKLYCDTPEKLLKSPLFEEILRRYLRHLRKKNTLRYEEIVANLGTRDEERLRAKILLFFKLLMLHRAEELPELNPEWQPVIEARCLWREFVEGFYNFWRSFERYLILPAVAEGVAGKSSLYKASFVNLNEELKGLILRVYRTISTNLTGEAIRVYRQLPAGANLGALTEPISWEIPSQEYSVLAEIPFIRYALLEPPIIFYPRQIRRQGAFVELSYNPLAKLRLDPEEWFCYPAKVGPLLIFIYFWREFASLGFSLANLFELADKIEIQGARPDAILIFGGPRLPEEGISFFYEDRENDLVVGYVIGEEIADYFGYLKKTTLTLHNIIMIRQGRLPLHGAGVHIVLKDGSRATLVIVGDSGAGKSETLEAFRLLSEDYLSDMIVIFDDMGSISEDAEGLKCYGTEIGAFVRLDDLSPGYAFSEIDRSIFMNPHLTNARVVIPVAYYHRIVQGFKVDLFLYANNYEEVSKARPAVEFFEDPETALSVFRAGARMAKGTTDEKGLVHTYFANPFGAPQRREAHEKLARRYFEAMFARGVRVGQIRTRLALEGYEQEGPKEAARALFDLIREIRK